MLLQVLSLTPDQINALPPSERDAIQQLVSILMLGMSYPRLSICLYSDSALNSWAA
jgi:hypothetical protein